MLLSFVFKQPTAEIPPEVHVPLGGNHFVFLNGLLNKSMKRCGLITPSVNECKVEPFSWTLDITVGLNITNTVRVMWSLNLLIVPPGLSSSLYIHIIKHIECAAPEWRFITASFQTTAVLLYWRKSPPPAAIAWCWIWQAEVWLSRLLWWPLQDLCAGHTDDSTTHTDTFSFMKVLPSAGCDVSMLDLNISL